MTTNTIANICKAIVNESIDHDYLLECGSLATVYKSEYGMWNGTSPKDCTSYLQGLPSVCSVPFYNFDILELLKKHDIDVPQDDDGGYDLIEAYWNECGKAFYNLVK